MKEYQEKEVRCTRCKKLLHDKNSKNVGQCLACFAEMMSDDDEDEECDCSDKSREECCRN